MKIVPFVLSLAVAQRGWFGNHLDSKGFLIPRGLFKADAASHVAAGPIDLDKIDLDEIARGKGRNDGDLGEKGKKRLTEKLTKAQEREMMRKQKIEEKLSKGKEVGKNKREKGKTSYIDLIDNLEKYPLDQYKKVTTTKSTIKYTTSTTEKPTTKKKKTTPYTTKEPSTTQKLKTTTEDGPGNYVKTTVYTTKRPKKTTTKKPKPKTTTTTTTTSSTTTTNVTTTTTYKKSTTTEYEEDMANEMPNDDISNAYAPASEVKGDPHFMVRSPGQEAVCFDADAPVGERIVLLFDPVSGLSISGVIAHREALDRTVIDSMKIMTPAGVSMSMTHDSLMIEGYGSTEMEPKEIRPDLIEYNGSIIVGDVEIKALHRGNGLKAVRFTITDGPIFHVQEKLLTRAMGLVWDDESGLSDKTKGILGQFMKHTLYHITYHKHTLNKGTLHIHNHHFPVEMLHHTHHDCWTVKAIYNELFLSGPLSSFGTD